MQFLITLEETELRSLAEKNDSYAIGTPVLLYQLPLHDRRLFASIPA